MEFNSLNEHLKASSDALEVKIGELLFQIDGIAGNAFLINKDNNDTKVYNSNGELIAQASEGVTQFTFNVASADRYTIKFSKKYDFISFLLRAENSNLNVDDLKYSQIHPAGTRYFEIETAGVQGHLSSIVQLLQGGTLNRIRLKYTDIIGRLSELSALLNASSITELTITGSKMITGNLEELVAYTNLTQLNVDDSGVVPLKLKELLDGIAETRTSGTLVLQLGDNYVYNNAGIGYKNATITFTNEGWSSNV